MNNITSTINSFSVRLSSILLADDNSVETAVFKSLAMNSGGRAAVVDQNKATLWIYAKLIEVLRHVMEIDCQDEANQPVTIHQSFISSDNNEPTNGTFLVGSDLGRNTEFGIYVEDDEEHQIKSVTFADSNDNVYGPYNTMSSFYDPVNLKTINYHEGDEPSGYAQM